MRETAAQFLDHLFNRLSGVYAGYSPRRPNRLVIPRFVAIEERIPSLIEAVGTRIEIGRLRRPLVVTDPVTWRIAGEELYDQLDRAGLRPLRETVASNEYGETARILAACTREPRVWSEADTPWERRLYGPKIPSLVFGVGGGTVMDQAKLVACQLHVPCITVPTSLANDGIASPFAVIRPGIPDAPANVTVQANTPLGVLIDLGRIRPAPGADDRFFRSTMLSGIGDAVSNLAAVADWRLAARQGRDHLDYVALLQARSAGEAVLWRLSEGIALDDPDLVLTLASGLVSSGEAMTRVGSSRPASGFEHKFYHAFKNVLRFPAPVSHGVLVAVGTLVSLEAHATPVEPLRSCFRRIGLPVDTGGLEALGLERDQVEAAIRASVRVKPERYTILEHLGPDALVGAFRAAFEV